MKRLIPLIFLAVLLFVVTHASRLGATLITLNSGQSATFLYDGASVGCALCDASITLTFSGNSLSFSFTNTSQDNVLGANVLTQFAFDSTPNLHFGSHTFGGSASTWQFKTTGLGGFEFGADTSNGINDGLEKNQTGTLTLAITSPSGLTNLSLDDTQVHFQAILENGGSVKPEGCVSGSEHCYVGDPVPEPPSSWMFGAGLILVSGIVRGIKTFSMGIGTKRTKTAKDDEKRNAGF